MTDFMAFSVTYHRLNGGFRVAVDAGEHGQAEVTMPTARLAYQCAVPFMEAVSEPDPFESAFMGPSAPDGPGDRG
jgi:hypothetical protein